MSRVTNALLSIVAIASVVPGCTILNRDLRAASPCPIDVSNGLPAPTLFAHRGGAREAPESTILAFEHAVQAGADVLEIDVRLTRDHEFVVWHGPSLRNVRIEGVDDCPCARPGGRRDIGDYYWTELNERAAVADPPFHPEVACEKDRCSVACVPLDDPKRHLVLLRDFLQEFPCHPLNVEVKDFFVSPSSVARLVDILQDDPRCERCNDHGHCQSDGAFTAPRAARSIMVASANDIVLQEFRRQTSARYQTNIPVVESLVPPPIFPRLMRKSGRALQVPRWCIASGAWATSMYHRAGAAVHVFITRFLGSRGLDEEPGQVDQATVDALLDRHIDGIMTDRPCEVRPLVDSWLERRGCATVSEDLKRRRHDYCGQTLVRRGAMALPGHCSCPSTCCSH